MKKKLVSLIAFAIALVMAMTSLPVGAVSSQQEISKAAIAEEDCGKGVIRPSYTTGDTYPVYLRNAPKDSIVDPWNFYNRECTSFAAWCLNDRNGVGFTNQYLGAARWGHAKTWGTVAQGLGVAVNNNPAVGSIAWWNTGTYGHVAWVSAVNGSSVTIEEYNYASAGNWGTRTISSSSPTGYIHIKDIPIVPQPSKPEIVEAATCSKTWFQWNPCKNTLSYDIRIYHNGASEAFITEFGISSTYYSCHLDNGSYQVNIAAVNKVNGELAWTMSDKMTFTVSNVTEFIPSRVEEWNGHTYLLYDYDFASWIEAKSFCEQNGGHLATITSSEENSFIKGVLQNSNQEFCWLGGRRFNSSSWQWVTGEQFGYSNWQDGEPNNTSGYEDYIGMWRGGGRWNDFRAVRSGGCLILEKDYIEQEPTPTPTAAPITPSPDEPQIVVSSKTVTAGSTVTVDVSLLNNPGIVSMALAVDFDERLELVSVTDSGLLPGQVHSPTMGNPYTLFWSNDTALENYVVDGVLATLTFAIPEDMPVGEYPITISYDLENYDIYNCDVETVEFAVVNGKVNVIDVLIGDVNTDTKVNNLDKLVFTRFLAKWTDYPETVINMIAADVNLDTKVNNLDKLILTRHLARWAGYETLPYTAKSAHEAKHAEIKGDEPTIIVDSVTANPGETVTVNVSLANNPGIVSMSLTMAFDPMLELVAVNDTGLLPGKVHSPTLGNPYTLFWANDTALENYVVNGSLVELTFKLSENAEPGTYPITITYDLDNYDIYNCDVELVEFAVVNGGVTYQPDEPITHTVTFVDPITGEVIAEATVNHGEAAEAPEAPAHEWYTFTGWDADFSEVTEDITVTAQYTELGDMNGDGTVDISDALAYMRWLIGADEIACDEAEADFNGDGSTDLMDALLLMRHVLGTI